MMRYESSHDGARFRTATARSHHGPQRAAKSDEDAAQDMWGQRFAAAAELPLGAERYVSAGSAGDLVAGVDEPRLRQSDT